MVADCCGNRLGLLSDDVAVGGIVLRRGQGDENLFEPAQCHRDIDVRDVRSSITEITHRWDAASTGDNRLVQERIFRFAIKILEAEGN